MTKNRIILIITLITLVSAYFAFDLGQYLTLEYFKTQQAAIEHYQLAHPIMTAAGFFVIYFAVTGLSLPGTRVVKKLVRLIDSRIRTRRRADFISQRTVYLLNVLGKSARGKVIRAD